MERAARLVRKSKYSSKLLTNDDLARAIWPTAVGRSIAAHTSSVKVVRNLLVVEVEDAVWQRQLFPLTAQILARLHAVMGSDVIQDVEFRVAIPRRQPMKAGSREGLAIDKPSLADDADSIQDPVLKKVYQLSRKKAATA